MRKRKFLMKYNLPGGCQKKPNTTTPCFFPVVKRRNKECRNGTWKSYLFLKYKGVKRYLMRKI